MSKGLSPGLVRKMVLIAGVVVTKIQAQDIQGQDGDREAGRDTVPLRFGDAAARLSAALGVVSWTAYLCCSLRQDGYIVALLLLTLGSSVAWQTLRQSTPRQNRMVFWL